MVSIIESDKNRECWLDIIENNNIILEEIFDVKK